MFCTQCGTKLNEGARFCTQCGKQQDIQGYGGNWGSREAGFYSNEEDLLGIFVGPKKREVYEEKWKKKNSFNWAGFILGIFWLGYRKMYTYLFIVIGAFLVIDILTALLEIESTFRFNNAIGIIVSFIIGFAGNQFYKKHADKKIDEAKRLHSDPEEIWRAVSRAGGTSWGGVFIAIGTMIAYVIIAYFITSPFTEPETTEYNTVKSAVETDAPETETLEIEDPDTIIAADETESEETIQQDLEAVVAENIEALRMEDIDRYMETIYPSGNFDYTKNFTRQLFDSFDLEYEISSVEVIEADGHRATVRVRQVTRNMNPEPFRDNDTTLFHTLLKDGEAWKIAETNVENLVYLDEYADEEDPGEENPDSEANEITAGEGGYTLLEADRLFDFELRQEVDINHDGNPETVILRGAPGDESTYLNEDVEIILTDGDSQTSITAAAESAPLLYVYDIDGDGYDEFFYSTGYRANTISIYRLGEEGLELYGEIEGVITGLLPNQIITDYPAKTYNYDEIGMDGESI